MPPSSTGSRSRPLLAGIRSRRAPRARPRPGRRPAVRRAPGRCRSTRRITPWPSSRSIARPRGTAARASSNSPFIARSCASTHMIDALRLAVGSGPRRCMRSHCAIASSTGVGPAQRAHREAHRAARDQALRCRPCARGPSSARWRRWPGCSGRPRRARRRSGARPSPARMCAPSRSSSGIAASAVRSGLAAPVACLAAVQPHEHADQLAPTLDALVAGRLAPAAPPRRARRAPRRTAPSSISASPSSGSSASRVRVVGRQQCRRRGAAGWRRRACRRARRRAGRPTPGAAPRRRRSPRRPRRAAPARRR